MSTNPQPQPGARVGTGGRRRAVLVVGGVAALALLIPVGLLALVGRALDPAAPLPEPVPTGPPATLPPAPSVAGGGGWDVAAQTELARRPMPALPESAAWPQPLAAAEAGPPFTLPRPTGSADGVPVGFPPTVEGAIAQLAALTRVGLEGGDPQVYGHVYETVMLPGAPPARTARLYRDLGRVRAGVLEFPATGPVPGLVFTWTPTSALVKGTTDGNRYAVVCVLGELVTGIHGQSVATGAGDCQALRRVDGRWRISPGVAAAAAPLAWPGSADAVRAGYRAVRS